MKYAIRVTSEAQFNAVIAHFKKLGHRYNNAGYADHTMLMHPFKPNGTKEVGWNYEGHHAWERSNGYTVVEYADAAVLLGIESVRPNTVVRVGDYQATINYNRQIVTIASQEIPFATIEKIAGLLK